MPTLFKKEIHPAAGSARSGKQTVAATAAANVVVSSSSAATAVLYITMLNNQREAAATFTLDKTKKYSRVCVLWSIGESLLNMRNRFGNCKMWHDDDAHTPLLSRPC